ncbi:MAG: coproporphyrinogen dehydrogenase HemZ [Eubacteriales bacterium]|nr:coproporphyrinogen dehydrogenase HemZ [Eubacteriales bacterium]
MKVQLIGHDEKYALEQSLLTLFPDERPVYGTIEPADTRWAIVRMCEESGSVRFTTELGYDGKNAENSYTYPLSGTDYEREGQRRHALGLSFFGAARKVLGISPAWGSLTGVRPTKVAMSLLREGGKAYAERELANTYFVTPERIRLAMESADAGIKAAAALEPNDISLYVGIPFCPTRCAYCSFVAQSVEKSFALVEPYLDALCDEAVSAGQLVRDLGLNVKSFYMGGGTPTTLTAPQMDRLLTALEKNFDFGGLAELTIEAGRPDTIDPEKLSVLRAHNTTRVSINPQTMEDNVLAAIGRRHKADDIRRAMEQVRAAGFPHVNMDLIAGLPEDTAEGFARSLDEVVAMGADNITVHTLSLKKGSRIMLEGSRIPSAEEVSAMLDYANPTLRKHGFAPYYLYRQKYMSGSFENVGWTKPGAEGLYNIYIMEELHSILSLGAGGSTKMVGVQDISRAFNAKYPKEYIERPEKWRANLNAFAAFYCNMMTQE